MPVKLLLADDHAMFRELIRNVLYMKGKDYVIIADADNGPDTLILANRYQPDLLLLDYKMPGMSHVVDFCREVAHRSPGTRILILSGYDEEEVALQAAMGGAQGYIVKGSSVSDLLDAISTVNSGGIWVDPRLPRHVFDTFLRHKNEKDSKLEKLSRQEVRVLSLVAQTMSNKEISLRLHISRKTVKNHLTHVLAKLGTTNRQEATLFFLNKAPSGDGSIKAVAVNSPTEQKSKRRPIASDQTH